MLPQVLGMLFWEEGAVCCRRQDPNIGLSMQLLSGIHHPSLQMMFISGRLQRISLEVNEASIKLKLKHSYIHLHEADGAHAMMQFWTTVLRLYS